MFLTLIIRTLFLLVYGAFLALMAGTGFYLFTTYVIYYSEYVQVALFVLGVWTGSIAAVAVFIGIIELENYW